MLVLSLATIFACAESAAPAPEGATPAEAAAPPAPPTPAPLEGTVYGTGVALPEATPLSAILADIPRYDGQKVRVEGTVTEVCAKRGCWMEIAGDQAFQSLRFKVEDGVITIPIEAKGRYAVAEGTVHKIELTPEDAQAMREHEAEEQGKPVDSTTPLPTFAVRLAGAGAVIRDRK